MSAFLGSDEIALDLSRRLRASMFPQEETRGSDLTFTERYEKIFGWPMPSYQKEVVPYLEDDALEEFMLLASPGHSKSTILCFTAADMLGRNPNERIMIATHTETYSAQHLQFIEEIMLSPAYKEMYGDLVPSRTEATRWTNTQKFIRRSEWKSPHPSLLALGVGSSTIGYRATRILCHPAGELVVTYKGLVPIQNIAANSSVLGHDGDYHRVESVQSRHFTGELVKIRAQGWPTAMMVTPDHPILVLKRDRCTLPRGTAPRVWCRETCINERRGTASCHELWKSFSPMWISARDVQQGTHCLLQPRSIWTPEETFIPRLKPRGDRGFPFKSDSPLFWWLVGLYLADGSSSDRYATIALNANTEADIRVAERVKRVAREVLGCAVSNNVNKSVHQLTIHSARFSRLMKLFVRGNPPPKAIRAHLKFIPLPWLARLNEDQARHLLRGFVDGDGCRLSNVPTYRAVSTSLELLWQLRQLGLKFGWAISIANASPASKQPREIRGHIVTGLHDKWELRVAGWVLDTSRSLRKSKVHFTDEFAILPVRSVAREEYSGLVYSLSVEGHNYATPQGLVHNCDDLVTQQNSLSSTMRMHLANWYFGSLTKRLDRPGGRIIIIGARFYKQDLYGELLDLYPHKVYGATPESPLWPEKFTAEMLEKERNTNYVQFKAQYEQDPIDLESGFLRESDLHYYLEEPPRIHNYIACDLSHRPRHRTRRASSSDPFALNVSGYDPLNKVVYIRDFIVTDASNAQMKEIIKVQASKWNPVMITIESDAAQDLFVQEMIEETNLPIQGKTTEGIPKAIRFAGMSNHFRNKKALVKGIMGMDGRMSPHTSMNKFIKEWRSYGSPKASDHCLDTVELNLRAIFRIGGVPATGSVAPRKEPLSLGSRYALFQRSRELSPIFQR